MQSLDWEDPLEEEMATHSSILAWRIPWTEEPGGLQYMGSQLTQLSKLFYIAMCLHTLLFLFFNVTMLSIATAPLLIPCLLSPQLLWVAHFPTQN